ncbi:hypothetical protein Agub_g3609, partial [Astrephomene gubernaculifera]
MGLRTHSADAQENPDVLLESWVRRESHQRHGLLSCFGCGISGSTRSGDGARGHKRRKDTPRADQHATATPYGSGSHSSSNPDKASLEDLREGKTRKQASNSPDGSCWAPEHPVSPSAPSNLSASAFSDVFHPWRHPRKPKVHCSLVSPADDTADEVADAAAASAAAALLAACPPVSGDSEAAPGLTCAVPRMHSGCDERSSTGRVSVEGAGTAPLPSPRGAITVLTVPLGSPRNSCGEGHADDTGSGAVVVGPEGEPCRASPQRTSGGGGGVDGCTQQQQQQKAHRQLQEQQQQHHPGMVTAESFNARVEGDAADGYACTHAAGGSNALPHRQGRGSGSGGSGGGAVSEPHPAVLTPRRGVSCSGAEAQQQQHPLFTAPPHAPLAGLILPDRPEARRNSHAGGLDGTTCGGEEEPLDLQTLPLPLRMSPTSLRPSAPLLSPATPPQPVMGHGPSLRPQISSAGSRRHLLKSPSLLRTSPPGSQNRRRQLLPSPPAAPQTPPLQPGNERLHLLPSPSLLRNPTANVQPPQLVQSPSLLRTSAETQQKLLLLPSRTMLRQPTLAAPVSDEGEDNRQLRLSPPQPILKRNGCSFSRNVSTTTAVAALTFKPIGSLPRCGTLAPMFTPAAAAKGSNGDTAVSLNRLASLQVLQKQRQRQMMSDPGNGSVHQLKMLLPTVEEEATKQQEQEQEQLPEQRQENEDSPVLITASRSEGAGGGGRGSGSGNEAPAAAQVTPVMVSLAVVAEASASADRTTTSTTTTTATAAAPAATTAAVAGGDEEEDEADFDDDDDSLDLPGLAPPPPSPFRSTYSAIAAAAAAAAAACSSVPNDDNDGDRPSSALLRAASMEPLRRAASLHEALRPAGPAVATAAVAADLLPPRSIALSETGGEPLALALAQQSEGTVTTVGLLLPGMRAVHSHAARWLDALSSPEDLVAAGAPAGPEPIEQVLEPQLSAASIASD